MPVKVKQINEYLISDTVQSQKKSGSDEISQGHYGKVKVVMLTNFTSFNSGTRFANTTYVTVFVSV